MIKEEKLAVYQERLYCDKCGTEMYFSGEVLLSYPPQFPHVCPKCGFMITTKEQYPKLKYIPITGEE